MLKNRTLPLATTMLTPPICKRMSEHSRGTFSCTVSQEIIQEPNRRIRLAQVDRRTESNVELNSTATIELSMLMIAITTTTLANVQA